MTKQILTAKIKDIAKMDSINLEKFKKRVTMSDIDEKTRFYLYDAIDKRYCEIRKDFAMTENGEIKVGEV